MEHLGIGSNGTGSKGGGEENGRVRSASGSSNISHGSAAELITKTERTEVRRPPPPQASVSDPGVARDKIDMKTAAGVMNMLLRRSNPEQNNNNEGQGQGAGASRGSRASAGSDASMARR